jgi:hypothetical protein
MHVFHPISVTDGWRVEIITDDTDGYTWSQEGDDGYTVEIAGRRLVNVTITDEDWTEWDTAPYQLLAPVVGWGCEGVCDGDHSLLPVFADGICLTTPLEYGGGAGSRVRLLRPEDEPTTLAERRSIFCSQIAARLRKQARA